MKTKYIIISSLAACIFLYFAEQVIMADYISKTLVKILLFVIIPCIYIRFIKKSTLKEFINYNKIGKQHLKISILLGAVSFLIIFLTFRLTKNIINLQDIAGELENKSKITPENFAFAGLYITFGNSFLEEFFFRGFIFLNLYESKLKKAAYVYSSLLFALYHIAIFKTWFSIWLTMLSLAGLIIIGFIFDWLDTKSQNFVNSWIVHIFSDSAIILIGLKMFMII